MFSYWIFLDSSTIAPNHARWTHWDYSSTLSLLLANLASLVKNLRPHDYTICIENSCSSVSQYEFLVMSFCCLNIRNISFCCSCLFISYFNEWITENDSHFEKTAILKRQPFWTISGHLSVCRHLSLNLSYQKPRYTNFHSKTATLI